MIARQANRIARFRLTCLASAVACLLPALAAAEQAPWEEPTTTERMPWEPEPEGPSLWDDPTIEGAPVPPAPPIADDQAAIPAPVDTGPDIPAPNVDAYFDVSFNDSSLDAYGFASSSSGYRFIVGFILEDVGGGKWTFAPEFGYFRMNTAEGENVTVYDDYPGSNLDNYRVTETASYSKDISTLDLGARFGFPVNQRFEIFARTGVGFYHTNDEYQVSRSYTPKYPTTPPRNDDYLLPSAVSDAGLSPYASLGAAVGLGEIPSFYLEYTARSISGEALYTTSAGFLLNF